MEKEKPYFDKRGREIKEFALLKIYHFTGTNEQGRGKKHYYMYKWIRLKEWSGKLFYIGHHLTDDTGGYFQLRAIADKDRRLNNAEIIQSY